MNIEEDLEAQGFARDESYDIIVAANVLHATHNMDHTMSKVNTLLKPDGKLVLVEASPGRQVSGELIFGLLPGWWMGKQHTVIALIMLMFTQELLKDEWIAPFSWKSNGKLC